MGKLTRWQKFSIKLQMRYRIRREYFTLVIPVVIAIAVGFYMFSSGYSSTASTLNINSNATQVAALKQAQFEALSGNVSALEKGIHTKPPPSTAPEEQNLYLAVVAVPIIALTPYVVDITREERKKRNYEQDFADFLFEMSELVRGGIDPAKAFLTLSEGEVGSITKFVKTAARQMMVGFTFEQALHNLGDKIDSDLAKRYIDLVIQASYSGGSVSNLIQTASIDMGTFLTIDKEKRSGLSQYTMILYTGQVVLIVLAAILVVQFIPELNSITKIGAAGLTGLLGTADIADVPIERDLFFLVYLNGIFGGLVIGKISEGKIKYGLKHSLILILIALIAWDVYVLPASTATSSSQNVNLSIVSYDKTGIAGFALKDPLVVNVTNSHGVPVPDAVVTFIMTGGGIVKSPSVSTDATGAASTDITLGDNAGVYVVLVTCENAQVDVVINATSFS